MKKFSALMVLALAACGPNVSDNADGGGGGGGGDGGGSGSNEFADARPAEACNKMDIVFIVDDSGSMSEEQANLTTNFPQFANVLDTYTTMSGDTLDYRLAVTTTGRDVDYTIQPPIPGFPPLTQSEDGDNGKFRKSSSMPRPWIERADGNVATTFANVAKVGTSGPSLEMPLYALQLALTDRVSDGSNAGFLREDALLAVVILTDEDDCSREDNNFTVENDACGSGIPQIVPTMNYVNFLDGVVGNRGRWATAVIAGPTDCSSAFGDAYAADRLQQFVGQAGSNAVFSSICDGNLSAALAQALDTFSAACDNFPPIE